MTYPHDPNQPTAQPPTAIDVTRGLLVAGAAMATTAGLLVAKWFLMTLFGTAGVLLLLVLLAGAGAYLSFRKRDPQQARAVETRVRQLARNAVAQRSARQPGYQPPVTATQYPVNQFVAPTTSPAAGAGGFTSALLLLPSLLAYGLVYGSVSFDSAWQPWWIGNGLNLFLLICIAVRARPAGRRTAALLPGIAGLVIVGLATSPSPNVNLVALFSTKHGYGNYSYLAPPDDLLPWLSRAPALCILLFIMAWGISRREGSWFVGLLPAALLLWWSIWYREHEFTGEAGWIGFWGLTVGVFIGGCLSCWAADSITRPRMITPAFWTP